MHAYCVHHDPDLRDGGTDLLLCDVESLAPVAKVVRFVNVDAGAIARPAVVRIVCHEQHFAKSGPSRPELTAL